MSDTVEEILSAEAATALRPVGPLGWRAPMLATLTERRFSSPDWIFERKLDGVRAIVSADGRSRPRLWSRNHNDVSASYPELVDAIERAAPPKFIADGEIVAFDGAQTSFARLQGRIHLTKPADIERAGVPVFLYLFDLLALGQVDLTGLALRDRKRMLRAVIDYTDGTGPVTPAERSDQTGRLRFSVHRNTDGEGFYAYACAHGWEGLIAKRADSTYQGGRSSDWLKFKCVRDQEFVVGGFTEPAGSRTGLGALLVGYYERAGTSGRSSETSRLRYAGKVGTGFDRRTLTDLRARLDRLEQPDSPFADPVRERTAHWVAPDLVVQVGFSEWTRDGRLRHPRYTGIRTDKQARQVVRESG